MKKWKIIMIDTWQYDDRNAPLNLGKLIAKLALIFYHPPIYDIDAHHDNEKCGATHGTEILHEIHSFPSLDIYFLLDIVACHLCKRERCLCFADQRANHCTHSLDYGVNQIDDMDTFTQKENSYHMHDRHQQDKELRAHGAKISGLSFDKESEYCGRNPNDKSHVISSLFTDKRPIYISSTERVFVETCDSNSMEKSCMKERDNYNLKTNGKLA